MVLYRYVIKYEMTETMYLGCKKAGTVGIMLIGLFTFHSAGMFVSPARNNLYICASPFSVKGLFDFFI